MARAFSPNPDVTPELLAAFESRFAKGSASECWLWTGAKVSSRKISYGRLTFHGARHIASRIAYLVAFGDLKPTDLVCHSCDNPPCVNPAHLWLGTSSDNSRDMVRKGRGYNPAGGRHPRAILTENDVREIRSSPKSLRELGRLYGVDQSTIHLAKKGQNWSTIQ